MRYVIVSRHPAAVEFIRAKLPEFTAAPVVEQATGDDVREAVVAGNLPLHLAALAAQVIAVEFAGPPPRGTEYTVTDMAAAGATLRRYVVAAVPEPDRTIEWSDGRKPRGHRDVLLVGRGDDLHKWTGTDIPGICVAAARNYRKNGKWSATRYTLRLAPGAWHFNSTQSWEEGDHFHGCESVAAVVAELRKNGCSAPAEKIAAFMTEAMPHTMARIKATEASLASTRA